MTFWGIDCEIVSFDPSATLFELWTNPISEIDPLLNHSLAAAVSNMMRFSEVREPIEIT